MKPEIILTGDGFKSLYRKDIDETYHSRYGALTESRHVFIEKGYKYMKDIGLDPIRILEVGFGTGLNALLTCWESYQDQVRIEYSGIEKYPIDKETVDEMGYQQAINHEEGKNWFTELHANAPKEIHPFFKLNTHHPDIHTFKTDQSFDLIYFDAFAPTKQPDMWTLDVFKICHDTLKPGGILVTYCSQGNFRRTLAQSGMIVNRIPGPPCKREIVRAEKPQTE